MKYGLITIGCLFFAQILTAGEWSYKTPPSAIKRIVVNDDWRSSGTLNLPITVTTPAKADQPVLCSFFIETKQDWWFESAKTFDLRKAGKKTFSLNMEDGSLEWKSSGLRRRFGPDVLRWVKCWGIKVFSTTPANGVIHIGKIQLSPAKETTPEIKATDLQPTALIGEPVRLSFFLRKFRDNPFSQNNIKAEIRVTGNGKTLALPAFYIQEFIDLKPPFSKQMTYHNVYHALTPNISP